MFKSLKAKIFVMVGAILLLVAVLVILLTKRDVEDAMFRAEDRSARNVLNLVTLDIQGRYRNLLKDNIASIGSRKARLANLSDVVVSGLRRHAALAAQGLVGPARARTMALEWLRDLRYGDGEYFFVYGPDFKALAYPDPAMLGRDLTAYKDMKGRSVVKAMYEDARRYGATFSTFRWPAADGARTVKKFGIFTYFPQWDWIVASAVDIEAFEAERDRNLADIVRVLGSSMGEIKVADTGFVFLFDRDGKLLVSPPEGHETMLAAVNAATGHPLLKDIEEAVAHPEKQPLVFTLAGEDHEREAYVSYFKPLKWYVVATAYLHEIQGPAKRLITHQTAIILAVFVLSLLVAYAVASRIARPLGRLAGYAKALPEQDLTAEPEGESPIADLPRVLHDEVGRLAQSFLFMEDSLRANVRSLMETTAAKERIESELSIAHDIQMGLLPKIFPPFPERNEFDIFASLAPAKEVGGDLYDLFLIDDDHLCFVVGDVSGKGVPAALFMAITKTLVNNAGTEARGKGPADPMDPAVMMGAINNVLSRDNPNCMFVTLIVAIMTISTGEVIYSNGGHNLPVLLRRGGGAEYVAGVSGPMVGAMEDLDYNPLHLTLAPGEALLLYSDGVTEAMTEDLKLFSDERLVEMCGGLIDLGAQEVVDAVVGAVKAHAGEAEQSDDITVLCLRYKGI
ncbi:MAG: SpoIIE family protein phosphatase [Desulfovibrionaceae bacterium]|nr:SpoIIE family protein phosphatase [Desulfovibrionaceae bacterium]